MPSNSSDLARFSRLFSESQQWFIRFARTYTCSEIVAEDIVVEALMSYREDRLKISSEINPSAYVLTAVKNKCLNHLRHSQLVNEVSDHVSSHLEWELSNRVATLDVYEPSALFAGEMQNIIDHMISRLSADIVRIFVPNRHENKSHKGIAEIMGVTVKGVEFRISKTTKELRVALKDYLALFPFLHDSPT